MWNKPLMYGSHWMCLICCARYHHKINAINIKKEVINKQYFIFKR